MNFIEIQLNSMVLKTNYFTYLKIQEKNVIIKFFRRYDSISEYRFVLRKRNSRDHSDLS
jgi:hypothetical protein